MTNSSMDIKHMPTSGIGYNLILVTATSLEECKTIQDNLICVFGTPLRLICDQDPVVVSYLTQAILQSYCINP